MAQWLGSNQLRNAPRSGQCEVQKVFLSEFSARTGSEGAEVNLSSLVLNETGVSMYDFHF